MPASSYQALASSVESPLALAPVNRFSKYRYSTSSGVR
ncbi:hypothetical protein TC41_1041 [Alicyclobacillus acidocaldarius subsp. acidocaldarius Tc-4-1]|uniref:Uncharacterized protein n=1 Tax=Alicyclobacillus acidocaldarius (strain Tc-4-1) TaxID=1048834 RepID=F8IG97_ALIAT|nr:hypothetical protein TC41_1041 [Alicyclobacillus acidocaldarius subsp. acidocaldarius Tc-4-1]